MAGGRVLLLGGGFHLWHHQELWHLPSGPNGGVWRNQQSGLLDCFYLRVCHGVQWSADEAKKLDTEKNNNNEMKLLCKSCCTVMHAKQQFVLHGSSGPLSSVLTTRFGFQLVVMTGGLLISSGTIATSFATSINQMYITYGLVTGIELLSLSFVSLSGHHIVL